MFPNCSSDRHMETDLSVWCQGRDISSELGYYLDCQGSLLSVGHPQPTNWLCRINGWLFTKTKVFNLLWRHSDKEYFHFSANNSARQGLGASGPTHRWSSTSSKRRCLVLQVPKHKVFFDCCHLVLKPILSQCLNENTVSRNTHLIICRLGI